MLLKKAGTRKCKAESAEALATAEIGDAMCRIPSTFIVIFPATARLIERWRCLNKAGRTMDGDGGVCQPALPMGSVLPRRKTRQR